MISSCFDILYDNWEACNNYMKKKNLILMGLYYDQNVIVILILNFESYLKDKLFFDGNNFKGLVKLGKTH